jgi:hypothetical protein
VIGFAALQPPPRTAATSLQTTPRWWTPSALDANSAKSRLCDRQREAVQRLLKPVICIQENQAHLKQKSSLSQSLSPVRRVSKKTGWRKERLLS